MPSGKTHDSITFVLSIPTFFLSWHLTHDLALALVITAATIFSGLMFGPDLDTHSSQYNRWGLLRILWFPYKVVFRHRSRFSHGLLFGTIIRILYFTGVLAVIYAAAVYLRATVSYGVGPDMGEVTAAFDVVNRGLNKAVGMEFILAGFVGLWWGAATHTLSDLFFSVMKKVWQSF